jgi:hypothetical protein
MRRAIQGVRRNCAQGRDWRGDRRRPQLDQPQSPVTFFPAAVKFGQLFAAREAFGLPGLRIF